MRPGPEGNASSSAGPRVTEPVGTDLKKKRKITGKLASFWASCGAQKNKKN